MYLFIKLLFVLKKGIEMQVSVIMGSKSDLDVMKGCFKLLEYLKIEYEYKILSAHRNPEQLRDYLGSLVDTDVKVIIAAAGMAAHLPGVIASITSLPVIGVPLDASALSGVDALYSIVQMPSGVPVACMAIGSAGAKNAAVYAGRIIALNDTGVRDNLEIFKSNGCRI